MTWVAQSTAAAAGEQGRHSLDPLPRASGLGNLTRRSLTCSGGRVEQLSSKLKHWEEQRRSRAPNSRAQLVSKRGRSLACSGGKVGLLAGKTHWEEQGEEIYCGGPLDRIVL